MSEHGSGTALLKRLRASQPLNAVATSLLRGALRATGLRSEWIVKHVHRMGPVSSRLPNGRLLQLWSRGDDWVSNQVFWRGWRGYEPETAPLFFRLAQRSSLTLDVGAYVGFYSLLAAHANPEGRVLAFEPLPSAYERLTRHVVLNGLSNVECVASAVGAEEGSGLLFHVPGAELPTSSSLSLEFMKASGDSESLSVPVVSLDRVLERKALGPVGLIKIDTESTEPDVLASGRAMLARDRPWIVCEVLQGRGAEAGLEAVLRPLGYSFYLLTPEGPRLQPHVEGHALWLNYLLAPRPLEGDTAADA